MVSLSSDSVRAIDDMFQDAEAAVLRAVSEVRENPGDESAWGELEAWASSSQNPDGVGALYRSVLGATRDPALLGSLVSNALRFHEEWYPEDAAELLEVLRRALAVPTMADTAFQRLTVIFTSRERWSELLDVYDSRIESTEDETQRLGLLEEALQTARDFASDDVRSIVYLRRILAARPDDTATETALERALERNERWEDLVALLRSRIEKQTGAQADATRFQIAELEARRRGRPAVAIDEAAQLATSTSALRSEALALIEAISSDDSIDVAVRRNALRVLRRVRSETGDERGFVAVLALEIALAEPSERVALELEAGDACMRLGDAEAAAKHFATAFESDPASPEARAKLRAASEKLSALSDYADRLEAAAERSDASTAAGLRAEAASVRATALGDTAGAIVAYERLLEETEDPGQKARLCRTLADLHRAAGRLDACLDLLEREAAFTPDGNDRRAVLREVALLASELGLSDRALAAWNARLASEPRDRESLDAVVALLEKNERHADLVAALRRRVALAATPADERRDLVAIARIEEGPLGDYAAAIETWSTIASRFGETAEVVDALSTGLSAVGRFAELAALLERAEQREGTHLGEVRARLGDVYRENLGRPEDAVAAYERSLDAHAREELARLGLAQLAEDPTVARRAVESLAKSYAATDEWQPELALVEQRLAHAQDDDARVTILARAASLAERFAENPVRAFDYVAAAFERASGSTTLETELERLAARGVEADRLVSAYQRAAAQAKDDPSRRAHLLSRASALASSATGDAATALATAIEALSCRPRDEALASRVAELAVDPASVAAARDAVAAAAEDPAASATLLDLLAGLERRLRHAHLVETLARLAELRPRDLDALAEATSVAVEGATDEASATRFAERLWERAAMQLRGGVRATGARQAADVGPWALEIFVSRLESVGELARASAVAAEAARVLSPAERPALLRKAVQLAEAASASDDDILALRREVLRVDRDDLQTFEAMLVTLEKRGRHAEVLQHRLGQLERTQDPDRRLAVRLAIVELFDKIERVSSRVDVLRANLAERPGHSASIEAIVSLLQRERRTEELVDVLAEQAQRIGSPTSAGMWLRVARLAHDELGDEIRTRRAYEALVEIEPSAEAYDTLATLAERRGDVGAAARWLERRLPLSTAAEQVSICLRLASAQLAQGRRDRALEVLEGAFATHASDAELRHRLTELYRASESFEPLARVCAVSVDAESDPARRLELAREAARLYFHVLGRPVDAIPMLERAVEMAHDDKALRCELADAYRRAGRAAEARTVLEKLVEEYGRRRTPERAQVHAELGRVLEEMGDFDGAITQLDQATQIAVTNAPMLMALGRLAMRAGQADRAEKTYRTLLMLVRRRSPEEAVDVGVAEVLYELHSIAASRDEKAKADELLESALEAAAGSDGEAVRFVDALIERGEPKLALQGIERRLAARTGAADVELLRRHAHALEANGRGAEALDVHLAAAETFPWDLRLQENARNSASRLGQPRRYVELVTKVLPRLRRDEDVEVVARLSLAQASCLEVEVGDVRGAAAIYQPLANDPHADVARAARAGLARVLRVAGDLSAEREVQAAIRADATVSADERLEALYRIAELDLTVPERRSDAVRALQIAVDEDGRSARAATMLRAVAQAGDLDADGWVAYESLARKSGDANTLVDYLLCRAERSDATMAEVKEAVDRAIAAGQAARARALLLGLAEHASELDAADAKSVFVALAELEEGAGDVQAALRYLSRAADLADVDEARVLRLRIAHTASQPGGAPELALEAYRGLLAENAGQVDVLEGYLDLVIRLNDAAAVAQAAESVEAGDIPLEERNRFRRLIAAFYAATTGAATQAIELLRRVVSDDPMDAAAAQQLESLYEREGYDSERAGLLESRLNALLDEGPSEELVEVALRTSELYGKVDRFAAADVLRRVMAVVTHDRRVVESLLALHGPEDEARERVDLHERLIATEPLEKVALATLRTVAEWEAMDDQEGVLRTLELGLSRLGDDEVVRPKLEAMLRERGDDARLARMLVVRLDKVTDPLERRSIALEAASLLRDRLGDPSAAAEVLARLLEGPFDLATFREYVACLVSAERRQDAIAAITRALEQVGVQDELKVTLLTMRAAERRATGDLAFALADLEAVGEAHAARTYEPKVGVLFEIRSAAQASGEHEGERVATHRLAALFEQAGHLEQAKELLEEHCARFVDDLDALRTLVRLQHTLGDANGLRVSTEALVARTEGEERIEAALLNADACEQTGRLERAREILDHVRVAENDDRRIVDRLRGIFVAMGEHREVAQMLMAEAQTSDDAGKFDRLVEAGRILTELAHDAEAALEPLAQARELRPDDARLTVLLVDAYMNSDRLAEAGTLLESAIAAHPKRRTPELSQLQHRMGRYARATGEREIEMQWMVAAMECDKNNAECAAELAQVAMDLGDHETALNALRAITLAKNEGPISRAMAYLLQARIAHQRGESRRALLWARKAREVDPTLEEVDAFLKELGDG